MTIVKSVTPYAPGLCPRCRRGSHWNSACQPIRDREDNFLGLNPKLQKNGRQGPPRGPQQIYGVIQQVPRRWYPPTEKGSAEPPQEVPDWTSVPPPDSY